MMVRSIKAVGLGVRVAACVALAALAGFLLVALTGLANERTASLERFDGMSSALTGLLADNMAGSVRFARTAGIEAAFAGLKQNEPDLASVLVTDVKGERLVAWQRDGVAESSLAVNLPKGTALLDAADMTTVEIAVRPSRDADPVGTLRTVWSHQRLDAAMRAAAIRQAIISLVSMLAMIGLLYAVLRGIAIRPLVAMTAATVGLAEGRLDVVVRGAARRDELGALARSLEVFRKHMLEGRRLTVQQDEDRAQAATDKRASLLGMAETIETETTTALLAVSRSTSALAETATALSTSAIDTDGSAQAAASAAAQAMTNAQVVASAAEQLTSSIREIGGQMNRSAGMIHDAVAAGQETRGTMEALNGQVAQIGAVADMIAQIAGRTNLLALNATIEAARAGDAGKGFAVVASEVKQLATQTAHCTTEITRHIHEVRLATNASVSAVSRIEQIISGIDSIATSIAAAVEEQGAATAEIARSMSETATAADQMTSRITEVSTEAALTGQRAETVKGLATALEASVAELKASVIRVVRTATPEVDRRASPRYAVDLPCRLNIAGGGTSAARVIDLAEGGAAVRIAVAPKPGATGTLQIDGVAFALPFVVLHAGDGVSRLAFKLDEATAAAFKPIPERLSQRRAA
jgi:methyl-accepting chemotaxis protein